jgi:RecA-family ATPase
LLRQQPRLDGRPCWIDEQLSDWANRDIPPQDRVMEGWIPSGQCIGLYGVAGILKTRLLIQLLLAKSKGLTFLGIELQAGPVYGLFGDDTREEIVRRPTRIAKKRSA